MYTKQITTMTVNSPKQVFKWKSWSEKLFCFQIMILLFTTPSFYLGNYVLILENIGLTLCAYLHEHWLLWIQSSNYSAFSVSLPWTHMHAFKEIVRGWCIYGSAHSKKTSLELYFRALFASLDGCRLGVNLRIQHLNDCIRQVCS